MSDDNLRQKRFDAQLPATVVPRSLKARLLNYIERQKQAGFDANQSEVVRMALSQYLEHPTLVRLTPELKTLLEGYAREHDMTLDQAVQQGLQWFLNTQRGKR